MFLMLTWMRVYPRGVIDSTITVVKLPPRRYIPVALTNNVINNPTKNQVRAPLLQMWNFYTTILQATATSHLNTETWIAKDKAHAQETVRNLWMAGFINHVTQLLRKKDSETMVEDRNLLWRLLNQQAVIGIDYNDVPPNPGCYDSENSDTTNTRKIMKGRR
jgi:hypothetical protein